MNRLGLEDNEVNSLRCPAMKFTNSFRAWRDAALLAQDMQDRVISLVRAGQRLPESMLDDLMYLRLCASTKLREMLVDQQGNDDPHFGHGPR